MLWKVLSIVAALCLAAGAWFANINKEEHGEERLLSTRAKENLKSMQDEIETVTKVKATRDEELKTEEKKRDDVRVEVTKVAADTTQKEAEVDLLKKSYEEVTKQLTQLEDQIKKAGDIKKLMAQVDDLNKQKAATEAAISNQNQQLAFADEKIKNVNGEITRMAEVQKRQRAGVVEPGFTARVTAPFNEFGFVVLNKGNLGGMFANAMLDVKRGRQIVARLKVRDVEQSSSVADLVPGTLAPGQAIRSGDVVVAAPMPPPPPAAPPQAAPTVPPAGGAPGMAPPADPFGAPAVPAPAAPAMADPFAAPPAGAPAAPAPAPPMAPAGADPFAPPGAAPAPAPAGGMAPAPAAGADPFAPPGAAPAPAAPPAGGAPPAPAPPAGGAAPAGADPFAPKK